MHHYLYRHSCSESAPPAGIPIHTVDVDADVAIIIHIVHMVVVVCPRRAKPPIVGLDVIPRNALSITAGIPIYTAANAKDVTTLVHTKRIVVVSYILRAKIYFFSLVSSKFRRNHQHRHPTMFYQLLHQNRCNMNYDNHHVHYYTESKSVGIFHAIRIKIDILKYISIWSKIACNIAPVSTRRVDPAGIPIYPVATDVDDAIAVYTTRIATVTESRRAKGGFFLEVGYIPQESQSGPSTPLP